MLPGPVLGSASYAANCRIDQPGTSRCGGFRTDFLSDRSIRTSDRGIEDYSQTAHANVDHLGEIAGKQIGDPARGARAIMRAVEADEPPMHLVLGSDALRRTRQNQDRLAVDLDAWESVSLSTDFDG